MAEDLRLYFSECGSLKTYMQFMKMNEGMGEEYEVPIPFFLIPHPAATSSSMAATP
jgi:N-acyl homoserine lactone hydrolase